MPVRVAVPVRTEPTHLLIIHSRRAMNLFCLTAISLVVLASAAARAEDATKSSGVMLTHLAFYAGWPNVFSALPVAKDVFEKRPR
jgi:alkylhydroperoxidase/carboxymuconolactone decarboxylase family protein YurZ